MYTVPQFITSTSKSNMWCVFVFTPGPSRISSCCKVQIAMDDTTRVHIIQGRSHLTASRCRQVQGFQLEVSSKILPLQLLTFRTDFWTNFGPITKLYGLKISLEAKRQVTPDNVWKKSRPGSGRTCKAASWTHKCGSIWLESKVSRITEAKSPPAAAWVGSIPWVLWRDGLRMDMVWKYGLLWILCIINSTNSFISILDSILMDALTFIASMSSQYPFFWECPGLPRCFTARVLVGLQGPHMDPTCHNHLQVPKFGRKNSWWYPHRRLVNGNPKQKIGWRTGIPIGVSCQIDDSIAPSKQNKHAKQLTKDIEDRSLPGKRSIQTTHPHPCIVYIFIYTSIQPSK